jgi:hypothetical protein
MPKAGQTLTTHHARGMRDGPKGWAEPDIAQTSSSWAEPLNLP